MINKKLIERFLDGDCSEKEKRIVKKLLQTDPDFGKEFNLRLDVNLANFDSDERRFVREFGQKRKEMLKEYLNK